MKRLLSEEHAKQEVMKASRMAERKSPRFLPPIAANSNTPCSSGAPASSTGSPSPSSSRARAPFSYYHRDCIACDPAFTSLNKGDNKPQVKNVRCIKSRSLPIVPSKGTRASSSGSPTPSGSGVTPPLSHYHRDCIASDTPINSSKTKNNNAPVINVRRLKSRSLPIVPSKGTSASSSGSPTPSGSGVTPPFSHYHRDYIKSDAPIDSSKTNNDNPPGTSASSSGSPTPSGSGVTPPFSHYHRDGIASDAPIDLSKTNNDNPPGTSASSSGSPTPSGSGVTPPFSHYHRDGIASDAPIDLSKTNNDNPPGTSASSSGSPTPSGSGVTPPFSHYHRDGIASDAPIDSSETNNDNPPDSDYVGPLRLNRNALNDYVLNNVSIEAIEQWLYEKFLLSNIAKIPIDMQQPSLIKSKKDTLMELIGNLQENPNENGTICELARYISESIEADAHRIYKLNSETPGATHFLEIDRHNLTPVDSTDLLTQVAETSSPMCLTRGIDHQFPGTPHSLFEKCNIQGQEALSVIYQPIITAEGVTAYIIEMWRIHYTFSPENIETSASFLVWGSLALHCFSLHIHNSKKINMSQFLFTVVKDIFEEMASLENVIKKILMYVQKLVQADRASLFLIDRENLELVSTVFDNRLESGQATGLKKNEIRIPLNRGIAGHVATSGETLNIPDAYADSRFNREVDEKTGYRTINILCMPIKIHGTVLGVVQMVNKMDSNCFQNEDEVSFEIFSTFFGLALHHTKMYNTIKRKEQKYRVALEVLSYHNTCQENEVQAVMSDTERIAVDLNDFYFDPYTLDELQKCKAVIVMFDDLFDMSRFDKTTVTRFVLTVKKNYRTVPYHNFDHGWSVAHAMYAILKHDTQGLLDYKMRLALFVGCLCHDLDHRGYTNKYMSETASPLASMYTTSTLEHHHFNTTVTILQQDGHNIFSHMSSEEFKEILGYIRQCILATDLAAFFPNLEKMKALHAAELSHNELSWTPGYKDLAMAISMTAADLSASAKPWEVQIKTVKVIFEEFYDQGDKERAAGRVPIPMMDRNMPDEQPSSQVGFLDQICIPCYNMLHIIIPNTKPMYVMALRNLYYWKSKVARIENKKNGKEYKELEMEEISEEVLLKKEPEIVEEVDGVKLENLNPGAKECLKIDLNGLFTSEEEGIIMGCIHQLTGDHVHENILEDEDAQDVIIKTEKI